MSTGNGYRPSAEPDYRKLAGEVRAVITLGVFNTPEAIENLQQLAARYEALAEPSVARARAALLYYLGS